MRKIDGLPMTEEEVRVEELRVQLLRIDRHLDAEICQHEGFMCSKPAHYPSYGKWYCHAHKPGPKPATKEELYRALADLKEHVVRLGLWMETEGVYRPAETICGRVDKLLKDYEKA